MLECYLNQIAIYKPTLGTNMYNESVYGEAKEIRCRIVEKTKLNTNNNGHFTVYSSVIQCTEIIKINDIINDKIVVGVDTMTGLDGVIGYKGYLL